MGPMLDTTLGGLVDKEEVARPLAGDQKSLLWAESVRSPVGTQTAPG